MRKSMLHDPTNQISGFHIKNFLKNAQKTCKIHYFLLFFANNRLGYNQGTMQKNHMLRYSHTSSVGDSIFKMTVTIKVG